MMFVRSKATARAAAAGQQRTAAAPVARRTQQRIVRARAAEEESAPADEPAADEPAAEAPKASKASREDDGPAFSLSDAKRGNEWQQSDVDAALRYYSSAASGSAVDAPPREQDFVVNRLGIEDAAFFDDVDNNGAGTIQDAYAHAGVAEAAPKARPRPRRGDEGAADGADAGAAADGAGLSDELRDLEADKAAAAVFDELDLGAGADYEDMDGADAPWTWDASSAASASSQQQQQQGQQTRRGAQQAAAAIASFAATGTAPGAAAWDAEGIVASLGALDLSEAGVDPEAQELAALVTDDVAADADLLFLGGSGDDDGLSGLPADGAAALSAAETAAVDAVIGAAVPSAAAGDLADAPTYALDAAQRAELEAAGLSAAAVEAYVKQLASVAAADDASVSSSLSAKASEAPQPAVAVPAAVASARAPAPDAQAMAPAPAELLAADPALEAALDADAALAGAVVSSSAAADPEIASVVAELAELAAVPAVEYSAAMFPEAGDMAVFEQLVNATAEYMDAVGSSASSRDLDSAMLGEGVNGYDDLPEDLVSPTQLASGGNVLDDDDDANLVDGERVTWAERVLEVSRVTKVVKGGKIMGFRAVVVVGDGKGRIGVGCQSGREVGTAVKRALVDAKRSVVRIPIVGAHKTLPHKVEAWFKGARVVVVPAGPGTGVIAGGAVRSVLEVAGVQNCLAKRLGSRSNLNNARCTLEALGMLRTLKDVAELRGVPLARLLQ